MLLTSGQISMTISSFIVFVFTSILFLSGYALQQQTVRGLQAAIKPQHVARPKPTQAAASPALSALEFGDAPGSRGYDIYQQYLTFNGPPGGWKKAAYVQVVTDHVLVCNSVMIFAALHRANSKASRVLLYPRSWQEQDTEGGVADPQFDTTRRLLKAAARDFKVVLKPIESAFDADHEVFASVHPLVALFYLTTYKRVIHLPSSGLLSNPAALDKVFTSKLNTPLSVISSDPHLATILVQPSGDEYNRLIDIFAASPSYNTADGFRRAYPAPDVLLRTITSDQGEEIPTILETADLLKASQTLNATEYATLAGYVHISDKGLPGPEYDVAALIQPGMRPQHGEPRRLWEMARERFREERMVVCGLDLDPWKGDAKPV